MDIGDIALLKVVDTTNFGAFLDWPGERDILVPIRDQVEPMKFGHKYLVIICYDKKKEMYYASANISHYLLDKVIDSSIYKGLKLKGILYAFTPLGAKVALNNKYTGLLYGEELFGDIEIGQEIDVYVKDVREDGRIDLSLSKQGYEKVIDENVSVILTKLETNKGSLPFNDKSSPEEIRKEFNMSKKKFKEAIGTLYKQRKIKILDKGIELL